MHSREIQPAEWIDFFKDFSLEHRGEPVSIEVMGLDLGDQPEARNLPFLGISNDVTGDRRQLIEVSAGDRPDAHVTRAVQSPTRVRLAELEAGRPSALEIESSDGSTTLVRFLQNQQGQA